jgi:hypothetical protein
MSLLTWKHGKSKGEAITAIQAAVKDLGYDGYVKWKDGKVEACAGLFCSMVNAEGEVTEDKVLLTKSGGLFGGKVLARCRELLDGLFPGGEEKSAGDK